MASISKVAGEKGCDLQVGAGVYTPSGRHAGKKIHAIGAQTAAQITNFKHTENGVSKTVTTDNWIGVSLPVAGTTAFIPLGVGADSVEVASGNVMMYFD